MRKSSTVVLVTLCIANLLLGVLLLRTSRYSKQAIVSLDGTVLDLHQSLQVVRDELVKERLSSALQGSQLQADLIATLTQALTALADRIENSRGAVEPPETIAASGELGGSFVGLPNAGVAYSDYWELPADVQNRLLPFFAGTPPPKGALDAIHVSEEGWCASMSTPKLESPQERELARVAVQLFAEAKRVEAAFIAQQLATSEYQPCASNEEGLELARSAEHAIVKRLESGEFAVVDLAPLRTTRPDYVFRVSTYETLSKLLSRRGGSSAMLVSKWSDLER